MTVKLRPVAGILGVLIVFLGFALLLPAGVGLIYGEAEWWSFLLGSLASIGSGAVLWKYYQPRADIGIREGFLIVGLAWLTLSLIGAVPFVLSGVLDSYTDAFFEIASGFTTTGATILGGANTPTIEALPRAFLFWRSLAHWLGGMGIIVLTLAILPLLGVGGMQLYEAEVPGPSADKLTPRVTETAKRLWLIYAGITMVEIFLLWPAMGLFEAVNHAFATLATGGFSTENGSIGQYDSTYIEWVIVVFMFLAGTNFALHYRALQGKTITVINNTEFRVYAGVILTGITLVTLALYRPVTDLLPLHSGTATGELLTYPGFLETVRYAAFQVVAIVTTTGFGTANYELWPPLATAVIFLLFFCGGMGGSTGGGIKIIRHILMVKNSFREMKQLLHPAALLPIQLNNQSVSDDIVQNILSFFVLYLATLGFGTVAMGALGLDLLSAFGAAASCIGNIGPAFGTFGPTENYAHVPFAGKWILSFLMIAGRLELFTVMVLLTPAFWER
jgi:trk system potassium uptake protein TrkH